MSLPSLNSILLGNQYIGIEHYSLNEEEKVALLLIEKKQNELVIVKKENKVFSDNLVKDLNKNTPLCLVINTNLVIHKEVADIDLSDNKLLYKAFPNLKGEDFYHEIWRLQTKSIVAISRKSYIDKIISKYKVNKIAITGISLGACAINEIVKFDKKESFETNHQDIFLNEVNETIVNNYPKKLTTYSINGLQIQNTHLLAFSVVLALILNSKNTTGNLKDLNFQLYNNFQQKILFAKGSMVFIYGLLLILTLNFFIFNYYFKKSQENTETLLLSSNSIESVNKSNERIKIKEQLLKNLTNNSKPSSKLINEITKRIPQSILLSELIYMPIEKKVKEGEPINIIENTILISGTTINNKAFTNWIEELEHLHFLSEIVITHFGRNETNETVFSIKLNLKINENR